MSGDLVLRVGAAGGDLGKRVEASINAGCDMAIVANEAEAVDPVIAETGVGDTPDVMRREQLRPGPCVETGTGASVAEAREWVHQLAQYV
jgi:hypothetical protein